MLLPSLESKNGKKSEKVEKGEHLCAVSNKQSAYCHIVGCVGKVASDCWQT